MAQSRARESNTECSQRLAEQNMRTSQRRARESSIQQSQRLAEQNVRTSRVRARESSTERLQRLEEQNSRNIQSRTRESSSERSQRLQDQRERQQTSRARVRNRVVAHSNRSAFRYDPQIDYAQQSSVQIGDMNKICHKCSAKKWVDETNGIEAVNRTLQDLRNSSAVMGGITFVFAGDFRQTLPVINRGTRADIIKACLKSSPLWASIETLKLRTNMRAHVHRMTDSDFPQQLLKLGEGIFPTPNLSGHCDILLYESLGQILHNLENLIDAIYPDIENLHEKDFHWLCSRAIVSPKNDTVNEVNNLIVQKVPG